MRTHSNGDSCNNEETLGRRGFPLQTARFVYGSLFSLPESCIIAYEEILSLDKHFLVTSRPRCVVIPRSLTIHTQQP